VPEDRPIASHAQRYSLRAFARQRPVTAERIFKREILGVEIVAVILVLADFPVPPAVPELKS